MCVIALATGNRKMTADEFSNCWLTNNDGFGVAWREHGIVKYKKGIMKAKEAWYFYKNEVPCVPHTAHFRIATAGGVNPQLTHPFIISPDSPIALEYEGRGPVLFHNGVVSDYRALLAIYKSFRRDFDEGAFVSDSRVVAMLVGQVGREILDQIYGKWVLVGPDQTYYWGQFEKEKGIMYSNFSYLTYRSKTKNYSTGTSSVTSYSSKTGKKQKYNYLTKRWEDETDEGFTDLLSTFEKEFNDKNEKEKKSNVINLREDDDLFGYISKGGRK
jgi:hypothetical protein